MAEFCKDWGDINTAKILIIGQDPNLRFRLEIPEYCLCADYYFKNDNEIKPERKTYKDFAIEAFNEVLGVVNAGKKRYDEKDIYITNIYNGRLQFPIKGSIYIPDNYASEGVNRIIQILKHGNFDYVFPCSEQTNYWLIKNKVYNCSIMLNPCEQGIKAKIPYYKIATPGEFHNVCGNVYDSDVVNTKFIPLVHPGYLYNIKKNGKQNGYEKEIKNAKEYFMRLP